MEYKVCISTDKGNVKEVNQDSTMVKVANSDGYGRIVLGTLCDGMGGLTHGELASSMFVQRMEEWFSNELPMVLSRVNATEKLDESEGEADIIADISREWQAIAIDMNKKIFDYGLVHNAPLGTTAVVFLMIENEYAIMNIGDSRAYMISGDELTLLTHDQSVIQDMIDRGMMTPEEAENSPQKSVLLQCVGASDNVAPQFVRGEITEDSSIILCSDGFWRKLKQEEIIDSLKPENCTDEEVMKKNLDELVELVKSRKETDNISAVLMNCMDKKE